MKKEVNIVLLVFVALLVLNVVSAEIPTYTIAKGVDRERVEIVMSSVDWSKINTDKISNIRFDNWAPASCRYRNRNLGKCITGYYQYKGNKNYPHSFQINIFNVTERKLEFVRRTLIHELGHLEGAVDYQNFSEPFAKSYNIPIVDYRDEFYWTNISISYSTWLKCRRYGGNITRCNNNEN